MNWRFALLTVFWLPLLAPLAAAQQEQAESNWRLGAALGYGIRSNPLVQSDDIPIVVDLDIAWFGERWFFDNGDLGLTFVDNERVTSSIVARVNSDRVFFGRTDTRFVNIDFAGVPFAEAVEFEPPDRDYAIELGVEILTDGDWGALQLSAFHDVSDTHNGFEAFANYSFGWRNQRLYIEPSIGASYKSEDLNNYYWGVTPDEAGGVVPPYQADDGINWQVRLATSYQLTYSWSLSFVIELEKINDEAAMSPIVEEDRVLGWFAGAVWQFK